jgi:TusA-related sulfurtransferase
VVLFGFSEGQELTEHTSTQEALIQVLSGQCEFSVAGQPHVMKTGDLLYMPANCRHAVRAIKQFSMLLTLVKPAEKERKTENAEGKEQKSESHGACACGEKEALEVDARGLEPPQPLVKILEALSALRTGQQLRARTDRRPMLLFPQVEERGFKAETEEQSDGSFITQIEPR